MKEYCAHNRTESVPTGIDVRKGKTYTTYAVRCRKCGEELYTYEKRD